LEKTFRRVHFLNNDSKKAKVEKNQQGGSIVTPLR
jgi:hypothetical protein